MTAGCGSRWQEPYRQAGGRASAAAPVDAARRRKDSAAPRQAHGQQDRAEIGQRRPGAATAPRCDNRITPTEQATARTIATRWVIAGNVIADGRSSRPISHHRP